MIKVSNQIEKEALNRDPNLINLNPQPIGTTGATGQPGIIKSTWQGMDEAVTILCKIFYLIIY